MSYSALNIQDDDFATRLSLERPRRSRSMPFPPLLLIESLFRKSFSYSALPQEPLKLSIIKLDGSSFDIEAKKTATVLELKQAVEAVFSHMPQKGPGKISWPHVWGHFCLCYAGQKLLIETDHIRDYGIKDSDQLHFVRHVSISYILTKKRTRKGFSSRKHMMSIPRSISFEDEEHSDEEEGKFNKEEEQSVEEYYDSDDIENPKLRHSDDEFSIEHNETISPSFLGEWFPYSKVADVGTPGRSLTCTPNIATGLLGGLRKIFGLCFEKRDKRCCRKDALRLD